MIAWLSGVVLSKHPDSVVLDVGGVGYQLSVSLNTFCQVPPIGGRVSVEVHTHVREDQISLFGFLVPGERDVFRYLMAVAGIGPRLALNILSGIAPAELAEAVSTGNLRRLQTVPGVGKKTAERILIELKDKLKPEMVGAVAQAGPPAITQPAFDDLVLALTTLGYKKTEIDAVLMRLPRTGEPSLELLIKEALRLLRPKGS